MLKIEGIIKQNRLLRALTGLNKRAFESLLLTFEQQYQQSLQLELRKRASLRWKESSTSNNHCQIIFYSLLLQMLS
jgi:hypothetical protein